MSLQCPFDTKSKIVRHRSYRLINQSLYLETARNSALCV